MIERELQYCPFINKLWYHGSIDDPSDEGSLVVEIKNDDEYYYEYEDVPSPKVKQLVESYKAGSYFNNNIRGEYSEEKIEDQANLTAKII